MCYDMEHKATATFEGMDNDNRSIDYLKFDRKIFFSDQIIPHLHFNNNLLY